MTRPTAVVTGAGRGIGLATCSRFIEEGFHVLMADIDPAVKETAATLGNGRTTPIVADVSTGEGLEAVVNTMKKRGGALAALVNNAGIVRDVRLVNMTDEEFAVVIGVNLGATYQLTRRLIPFLGEGSAVVSISSRAYLGSFGQFNYTMSKGGLVGMTRALARELAPKVRVNIVAPGFDLLIENPHRIHPEPIHASRFERETGQYRRLAKSRRTRRDRRPDLLPLLGTIIFHHRTGDDHRWRPQPVT